MTYEAFEVEDVRVRVTGFCIHLSAVQWREPRVTSTTRIGLS